MKTSLMKSSVLLAFALLVTSVCSNAIAAPGSIHFTNTEVSKVLEFYGDLTGLRLIVDSRVGKIGRTVTIEAAPRGKQKAAELIEKVLLEQTGTVITRLDEKRASVTYNDALPITPPGKEPTKKQSGN